MHLDWSNWQGSQGVFLSVNLQFYSMARPRRESGVKDLLNSYFELSIDLHSEGQWFLVPVIGGVPCRS